MNRRETGDGGRETGDVRRLGCGRRHQGFSLVEVIISSAIVLALVLVVLQFLTSTLKESDIGNEHLDVQLSALRVMTVIQKRIGVSDVCSVNIHDPQMVSFVDGTDDIGQVVYELTDLSVYGRVRWQRHQILYRDPARRALRVGFVALAGGPTTKPEPYRLPAYTPQPTDRILVTNLDFLEFKGFSATGLLTTVPIKNPLEVTVRTCRRNPADFNYNKGPRVTLRTQMFLDNSSGATEGAPVQEDLFDVRI